MYLVSIHIFEEMQGLLERGGAQYAHWAPTEMPTRSPPPGLVNYRYLLIIELQALYQFHLNQK